MTNAVEHGLAGLEGKVEIIADRTEETLAVRVRDSGSGLPEGQVGRGLGTQIVRTLIQGELSGSIEWRTLSGDDTDLHGGEISKGTEVYISHRGMQEVYTQLRDPQNNAPGGTAWQPRPPDPDLEAEFLRRLMVRLGAQDEKARALMGAAAPVAQAELKKVPEGEMLQLAEPFDRAWRRVGLALDRVGFTVEDRDRQKGLYFVRYADPESEMEDFRNRLRHVDPGASMLETEYRFRHTDGSWHWALDRAYVIERAPDGSTRRVLGLVVDITSALPTKSAMLACHESQRVWLGTQHGCPDPVEQMTAWARARGALAGFPYGEGLRQHLVEFGSRDRLVDEALAATESPIVPFAVGKLGRNGDLPQMQVLRQVGPQRRLRAVQRTQVPAHDLGL